MPEKKPKGKELTNFQKGLNTLIASIRVKVEHAIAGVKRLKIIRTSMACTGQDDQYCLCITQPEMPEMGCIKN